MPSYFYTAKNKKGGTQIGQLPASDIHELANLLRQKGLVLISGRTAEEERKTGQPIIGKIIQRLGRVSLVEKMLFTRHLSVMTKAGLSLNQSLRILAQQARSPKLKKIISRVEQEIRQGKSFGDSLANYPSVFSNLYVNMVRVAEAGGNLDEVLDILAEQMRKDHELISRIRGAMMYPAVVIVAMIGIGIMMMTVVVPKLTEIFTELEVELPLSTRLIIALSNFLQNHLIWGFVILIVLAILMKLALKNKIVKRLLHRIYLFLPILGTLIQKINSARFARTLSSLIKSGVPIVKALQIVAGTLGNIHFREALAETAAEVQRGGELSVTLAKYKNIYLPMVIQMIKVGEETGKLDEILESLADFYEQEIDNTTKNLSSIIEPIIMVIIGAAVGFFAVSMVQPMYSMMSGL